MQFHVLEKERFYLPISKYKSIFPRNSFEFYSKLSVQRFTMKVKEFGQSTRHYLNDKSDEKYNFIFEKKQK